MIHGLSFGIVFFKAFKDWELEYASFFDLLDTYLLTGIGEDRMCWKLSRSGKFEVQSFYDILRGPMTISFPWRDLWRAKGPRKVLVSIHRMNSHFR